MTRPLRQITASLVLTLLVAACSTSTTADVAQDAQPTAAVEPTPTSESSVPDQTPAASTSAYAVVLLDAGAEPRVQLQTNPSATAGATAVTVTATELSNTTFGDTNDQKSFTGDYDLDLTIESAPDGFRITTDRTVRELNADGPPPDVAAIVGFRQRYTDTGLPIFVINEQEDAYRRLSGGLLSTPNLLLAAPSEAVGVGAQWTIPLNQTGSLTAVVTLIDITDSTIEIDLALDQTTDDGSFTMIASGTYHRTSMIAHNVTTTSTLSLDTQASENDQTVPVRSEQESVRIYQEVSS